MADPNLAFLDLMHDEDDPQHPGKITPEPCTHRCNSCGYEVSHPPKTGCQKCGGQAFTDVPQRARLGINSFANPDMPPEFWTGPYEVALPLAEARFLERYWNPLSLSAVRDQGIANKVINIGFNAGLEVAAKMAQEASGAEVDGRIGPRTIDCLNTAQPEDVIARLRTEQAAHYEELIAAHPEKYKIYEKNWLARAAR